MSEEDRLRARQDGMKLGPVLVAPRPPCCREIGHTRGPFLLLQVTQRGRAEGRLAVLLFND